MGEPPKRLGRGLSALLGDAAAASVLQPPAAAPPAPAAPPVRALRTVPVADIVPGRLQPRRAFAPGALEELAASIRAQGVLQPVLLRRSADDPARFELVAGERRWRAAQLAGLHEIPAVVRDLSDRETLEVALVENLQRADLNGVEEAEGYRRLMDEFGHTQEELARLLGKSRSHLANLLRVLDLPGEVLDLVRDGALGMSHAKALAGAANPVALARRVAVEGLSVRSTEQLARSSREAAPAPADRPRDPNLVDLERRIEHALGCPAAVAHAHGRGTLTLKFGSLAQLQAVLARLGVA